MAKPPQLFFVTLNWNTTNLLKTMIGMVEATTPELHTWIIVDNGSNPDNLGGLLEWVQAEHGNDYFLVPPEVNGHWTGAREHGAHFLIVVNPENVGLILAHNLAFDLARHIADGQPHEIVMVDTDVEIYERGWLAKAMEWADQHPEVGIVGMEHSHPSQEVCAPAIFIEPGGHWYLHEEQTRQHEPAEGESVGLGLALIRWPVLEAGLRFDMGYKLYGSQDDDLCFLVRYELGLEVWAYPIDMWHRGSLSLKSCEYKVGDIADQDEWNVKIRQVNQAYFARRWAWVLGLPRRSMADERLHLEKVRARMRARRDSV